jgi:hypothetical protein
MDSMTGLETKNILEKEYGIQITFKEIRSMTIARLLELAQVKNASSMLMEMEDSNKIEMDRNDVLDKYFDETIVRVSSLNNDVNYSSCVLVIPGFEGLASTDYSVMCSSIKWPTFVLPLFNTWSCQSIQEIAQFVFEVRFYLKLV